LPFVSDRRGGLLTTLEAEDLVALLDFLTLRTQIFGLAHALRSPVFGCSDEDLIVLASRVRRELVGTPAGSWQRGINCVAARAPAAAVVARSRRRVQRLA